jgi:hypothetical protein
VARIAFPVTPTVEVDTAPSAITRALLPENEALIAPVFDCKLATIAVATSVAELRDARVIELVATFP